MTRDSSTWFTKTYCISASDRSDFQIFENFPDLDWFKWTGPNPVRASRLVVAVVFTELFSFPLKTGT